MSLRTQLGWMIRGGTRTETSLQALGSDLRALQDKVDALAKVVARLESDLADGACRAGLARLDASVAEMRDQLRVVTDDLGDRVGAVCELLNSRG